MVYPSVVDPDLLILGFMNPDPDTDPRTPLKSESNPDPQHCFLDKKGVQCSVYISFPGDFEFELPVAYLQGIAHYTHAG
jgi:hypothetical protein